MFHMHFTMLFSVSKLNVRLFPKRCVCARVFFLVRLAREFRARQLSALCSPLFGSLNNLFNVYMKDAGQKSVANACGQERGRAGSRKKKLYFAQNNGRLDAFWASANSSGRHGWDVEKEYGFLHLRFCISIMRWHQNGYYFDGVQLVGRVVHTFQAATEAAIWSNMPTIARNTLAVCFNADQPPAGHFATRRTLSDTMYATKRLFIIYSRAVRVSKQIHICGRHFLSRIVRSLSGTTFAYISLVIINGNGARARAGVQQCRQNGILHLYIYICRRILATKHKNKNKNYKKHFAALARAPYKCLFWKMSLIHINLFCFLHLIHSTCSATTEAKTGVRRCSHTAQP